MPGLSKGKRDSLYPCVAQNGFVHLVCLPSIVKTGIVVGRLSYGVPA